MKFTCTRSDLLPAVQTVGRAVPSSAIMPILGHVLINAESTPVRLTSTDMEITIQRELPAQIDEPGRVTVPARILTELVSALPDAPVTIATADTPGQVAITCEASTFELAGLPPQDFPAVDATPGRVLAALDAETVRRLIRQTAFAVANDPTRPFLTGVSVTMQATSIRFAATDGGRLALADATLAAGVPEQFSAILPVKAVRELARTVAGADGTIEIRHADAQIRFTIGMLKLSSRLISGTFPNYQQAIPQSFVQRVRTNTDRLRAAIRRAAITARDSVNTVTCSVTSGVLAVTSQTPEVGAAREAFPAATEGDVIEVAFNARYLLDALHAIDTQDVWLELSGPFSPAVIRPADGTDTSQLLAPVRVYR